MIRVLHVHDDTEELRYVKRFLEETEESLKIESIASPDEISSILLNGTFDAILMNYRILARNGIEFEERVRRIKDIPFIMYPGTGKEAVADTSLRGAEAAHETDPRQFRILADRLVDAVKKDREIIQQGVSLKIFEALTRGSDLQSTLGEILRIVQGAWDTEAVGIRLQEGDDYPYFVFDGFHDEHIILENELCVTDLEGQMMRDDVGNPVLDCMCGNILRGRFDPSKPFFTEGGSFWTNSATELLASTTVEDRLVRTRNTCQGEGYESVALIPIRDDGETVGLLQMNDRRPGCFNLEMIGFLEGLGKIIGDSLGRDSRGWEALEELGLYRETLRSAPIPSLIIDPDDLAILDASDSAVQWAGIPRERLLETTCHESLAGHDSVCDGHGEACPIMEMLERRGSNSSAMNTRRGDDGEIRLIEESVSPIRNPEGSIERVLLTFRVLKTPSLPR
jgi:PAS domain-containing protein